MERPYYTLVVQEDDGRWVIEFGDFDKACVKDEVEYYCHSNDAPRRCTKILKTTDKQADINAAVAALNAN